MATTTTTLLMSGPDVPWQSGSASSPAAAALCARAFIDDPLQQALFPSPTQRGRVLLALFAYRLALCRDRLVVDDDAPLAPAAVMVAAASTDGDPLFNLAALPELGHLLMTVTPAALWRLSRVHAFATGLRRQLPPHVLLDLIAVDTAARGHGHAGRLVRGLLARARSAGLPVVLETSQADNVPLYRHLGFQVVHEAQVPGFEVPYVLMRAT